MKRFAVSILTVLAAAFLLPPPGGCGGLELSQPAIPRFQQVAEGLYRGGQPTPAGLAFLKQRGIRTVVDLRPEDGERVLVEKLGMKYVRLPVGTWGRVPDETVRGFFQIVRDPANQPVFVHCRRGADRTGMMVGCYRIAFQGWDGAKAYREARAIGMSWWLRGLKRQLYDFAAQQAVARNGPARDEPVAR